MVHTKLKGFTLFEILIALFILSIIGVIMVRGLQTVLTSKEGLLRSQTAQTDLNVALTILQNDINNIVNRSIVTQSDGSYPPVYYANDAYHTLQFTRGSVLRSLNSVNSDLLRVAYQLKNGEFVRLYWPVLDRSTQNQPISRVLLQNVTGIDWQFVNGSHQFIPGWPPHGINQPLPQAIQISLTLKNKGTIQILFAVNAATESTNDPYNIYS
jgi:general secretion pathway protein J